MTLTDNGSQTQIQFIFTGYYNSKPYWVSNNTLYNLEFNTSNNTWEVTNYPYHITSTSTSNIPLGNWTYYNSNPGTHTISVVQGTCSSTSDFTFNFVKNNTTTFINNSGSIIITSVIGGTPPYTYSKNNGNTYQSLPTFFGLTNGTYIVKVKDSLNNIVSQTITIS
jgi:hypothetical protein